jgi:diguanylate cyclase (GGDEF)-like protein
MLTDLPNRAFFFEMAQHSLNLAKRQHGRLALMFVDLDKFKPVNDEFGHAVGDLLLQQVAKRMTASLREADMVARIGGDEFVILLHRIEQDNDALLTAEKIRQHLGQAFEVEGHTLHISCSIGLALYPEHGEAINELTRHADLAMYQAKQAGRDNVKLFDTEMRDH